MRGPRLTVAQLHRQTGAMFHDIRSLHELHQAVHLQSLSMAEPRGLGFEDEPINASDYIMSGVSGGIPVSARSDCARVLGASVCLCGSRHGCG
jgi:hypothetical protein